MYRDIAYARTGSVCAILPVYVYHIHACNIYMNTHTYMYRDMACTYVCIDTHTHTHTHTYMYRDMACARTGSVCAILAGLAPHVPTCSAVMTVLVRLHS